VCFLTVIPHPPLHFVTVVRIMRDKSSHPKRINLCHCRTAGSSVTERQPSAAAFDQDSRIARTASDWQLQSLRAWYICLKPSSECLYTTTIELPDDSGRHSASLPTSSLASSAQALTIHSFTQSTPMGVFRQCIRGDCISPKHSYRVSSCHLLIH